MHLATEGRSAGRAALAGQARPGLTSAIHTRFPEYLRDRCPWLPLSWGYAFLRAFHRPSRAVLVSTRACATSSAPGASSTCGCGARASIPNCSIPPRQPRRKSGPGVPVCRAAGDGKEPGGVPRSRTAGRKMAGGRRPAAGGAGAALSTGAFSRLPPWPRTGRRLPGGLGAGFPR